MDKADPENEGTRPAEVLVNLLLRLERPEEALAVARRKDGDRRSFLVALGAGLVASPILWMHYLVLLVVPVALYRPRFGAAWFVPLAYWYLPGQENHGLVRNIALMLALTAITLALAMRRERERLPAPVLSSP